MKTKKLKKLWTKYQSATREVKEQADEFAVRTACYSDFVWYGDVVDGEGATVCGQLSTYLQE